jgi:hypothetical protein
MFHNHDSDFLKLNDISPKGQNKFEKKLLSSELEKLHTPNIAMGYQFAEPLIGRLSSSAAISGKFNKLILESVIQHVSENSELHFLKF